MLQFPCKQQQCNPIIHYKGGILLHITGYPVDMTIKLCPSTSPITSTFTTELHVCKQQHSTPTGNYVIYLLQVTLNISNILVDMYMKLHRYRDFNGPITLMCSHVCKQFTLRVNNNKPHNI